MNREVENGLKSLSIEKTIFFHMQKTRKKFCLWKIFYGDVVNLGLEDRIVEI